MNITRQCKHSSYVIWCEIVEGLQKLRYSASTPSLSSDGKIFSFLNRGLGEVSHFFVQDYSGASFLQFDNILDVPFVIGSPDNRPIVKYWLDNSGAPTRAKRPWDRAPHP